MYPVLKFLNVVFWEFIQNLGVVPAVAAVWWWARHSRGKAALAILVSAVGTPLTIFLTEQVKIGSPGRAEVIATNIVVFGLLQGLIVPYLGSEAWWSNAKTDVMVGTLAGIAISIAQATAAHDRIAVFVVVRRRVHRDALLETQVLAGCDGRGVGRRARHDADYRLHRLWLCVGAVDARRHRRTGGAAQGAIGNFSLKL
jgi:hypothetical protein